VTGGAGPGIRARVVTVESSIALGGLELQLPDKIVVLVYRGDELRACVEVAPGDGYHRFFMYGIDDRGRPFMAAGSAPEPYWEVYELEKDRRALSEILRGRYPLGKPSKVYRARKETVLKRLREAEEKYREEGWEGDG